MDRIIKLCVRIDTSYFQFNELTLVSIKEILHTASVQQVCTAAGDQLPISNDFLSISHIRDCIPMNDITHGPSTFEES